MDSNLYRYVGNAPSQNVDPTGLRNPIFDAATLAAQMEDRIRTIRSHREHLTNPFSFLNAGYHHSKINAALDSLRDLRQRWSDNDYDELCFEGAGQGYKGALRYAEALAALQREQAAMWEGSGLASEGAGPIELLISGKVGFTITKAVLNELLKKGATGLASRSSDDVVRSIGDDLSRWLGQEARVITNDVGDTIVLSRDGLRKVRFDFNTNSELPHIHLERLTGNGRWRDAIPGKHPIFPK